MSIYFYPSKIALPPGHRVHTLMKELPDRMASRGLLSDWSVKGPYRDEDDQTYTFVVSSGKYRRTDAFVIEEQKLLFSDKALESFISGVVSSCMGVEYSMGLIGALKHGTASIKEEVESLPDKIKVYVININGNTNEEAESREVPVGKKEESKSSIVIASH